MVGETQAALNGVLHQIEALGLGAAPGSLPAPATAARTNTHDPDDVADQLGCDGLATAQENEIPVETHTDSTN